MCMTASIIAPLLNKTMNCWLTRFDQSVWQQLIVTSVNAYLMARLFSSMTQKMERWVGK